MLRELGADAREVRTPAELEGLDALVIPGGESTTMTLGIEREGLAEPLRELAAPRHADPRHLRGDDHARPRAPRVGRLDVRAQRVRPPDPLVRGRPADPRASTGRRCARCSSARPWIAEHGDGVEVLAAVDGHPVAARQGNLLVISFHPEIAGERRLHELFLTQVRTRARDRPPALLRPPRRVGGEPSDRGGGEPAGGLGQALRARLGAGARARPPARGRGLELIVASTMVRAQETAQGIAEVLDLPIETDADLHRGAPVRRVLRVLAATTANRPRCTGCRPPTRDYAEPGAESFDQIVARVERVQERLAARPRSGASSRSATTGSCTSSSG